VRAESDAASGLRVDHAVVLVNGAVKFRDPDGVPLHQQVAHLTLRFVRAIALERVVGFPRCAVGGHRLSIYAHTLMPPSRGCEVSD